MQAVEFFSRLYRYQEFIIKREEISNFNSLAKRTVYSDDVQPVITLGRDFLGGGKRGILPPESYLKWLNDKINFII